jgi:hypothetical protein
MKSGMGDKKRIFNHFMFDDTNISELTLHQSTAGRLQLVVFQMVRRFNYNKEVEASDWSQKRSCFRWIVGAITTKKLK